jgi:toxin FitB
VRFLLDTNVISELRKPARNADKNVRSWAAGRRAADFAISVITVMEIEIGIARVERRDRLQGQHLRAWLEDSVLGGFADRILAVDLAVARRAASMHVPDPRAERDALVAATATEHGMTVATRNIADFKDLGVHLLDPWLPS